MPVSGLDDPGQLLQDPAVMERLVADSTASTRGVLRLIALVAACGSTMPGLVALERLALSLTTGLNHQRPLEGHPRGAHHARRDREGLRHPAPGPCLPAHGDRVTEAERTLHF